MAPHDDSGSDKRLRSRRWFDNPADPALTARPGVFVAGEMLDWEAPTGGYLLQACLATGRQGGKEALLFLKKKKQKDFGSISESYA